MSFGPPVSLAAPVSDDPTATVRLGVGVAVLFLVGFLGWAAIVPLDAASYAPGVVSVVGGRQPLQTRDGGVVSVLNVVEGQVVQAGQVLVRFDAGEMGASERSLTGERFALLAEKQRLIAELNQRQDFTVSPEFQNLSADDKALAADALSLQRAQFDARRKASSNQVGILVSQTAQLDAQARGAKKQIESLEVQRGLNREALDGMTKLAKQGYAPRTQVLALLGREEGFVSDIGAQEAQIGRLNEAMGQTRLQIAQVERQRSEDNAQRLRDVQVRLDDLEPKLAALRRQLATTYLRAPSSGHVLGLTVTSVGRVVAPGQTVLDIVPDDRRLVIQARVSPQDADDLTLGQATQIRFSTVHDRSLPPLSGKLTKLSADSLTDAKSDSSYFQAEVSVPAEELEKVTKRSAGRVHIQAGLPAEVLVPLRKRSALAYLLEPLSQTLWRTGREH